MNTVYYYLSLFPTEAIIASNLEAQAFAEYMASGAHRGAAEPLIFVEMKGDLPGALETSYIKEQFSKGPKKTVYLSVYRSLEMVPNAHLGNLYLVTREGRMLSLSPQDVTGNEITKHIYLYQELCPVRPLVASSLGPSCFITELTTPSRHVFMPRIAFADIRIPEAEEQEKTGNLGDMYYAHFRHMNEVVERIDRDPNKHTKVLGRSRLETFGYQLIDSGIYIGDQNNQIFYPMKSREELNRDHYAWAKSAQIL